jgi:hypothetical protein
MILTENGVLKLMQRIKSYIASQLNTKASSVHTHSISEIENLSSQLGGGYTKSEVDTLLNDYIPKRGGAVLSGVTFNRTTDNSYLSLCGSTDWDNGASITLNGKDRTDNNGIVKIRAKDNSNVYNFILYPNGTLTWGAKNIAMQEDTIPRSGGSVITATKLARVNNDGDLDICGGTGYTQGGFISVRGNNSASGASTVLIGCETTTNSICLYPDGHASCAINFQPTPDNTYTLGASGRRWKTVYSATSAINTSDSRLKNTISSIDDKLLDAWETIQPKQYKFNDATEKKGDTARFHTGYLAQDIEKACIDNDIDISKYGLFCYDSWEEEPEISEDVEVEKDGVKTTEKRIVQQKREKGDMYALRYEEALVVECAYLRRENNRLKDRLSKIENLLNI